MYGHMNNGQIAMLQCLRPLRGNLQNRTIYCVKTGQSIVSKTYSCLQPNVVKP